MNLFDYNVEERVDSFVKACKNQVGLLVYDKLCY